MSKGYILEVANKIINFAKKAGAQHSEVIVLKGQQLSVRMEEGSIIRANNTSITGAGLRVINDQKVGLGSSSQLNDKTLQAMATDAVNLAKVSQPDKDIVGFAPKPDKYPKIEGLFDKKMSSLRSEELVEIAIKMIDAALEKDDTINVSGTLNLTIGTKGIINSNGVEIADKSSIMNTYISSKITKDDDVGVAYEFAFGRKLDDIDPVKIGKEATKKAFEQLGGKKIKTGTYPILLDQRSSRQTIGAILTRGVSAFNIIQGTAFFSDRLAEKITGAELTVYDNPLENGSLYSRRFDDEGTPCQKTTIVEKGILKSYLSDVYTSHKLDIPNTGSSSKQGYEGIPHPNLQLIQIEPGNASEDELFAELDTGLYLKNGIRSIYGSNISQQVDQGFWVENGEIKHPIKNTMLGTTVDDLFKGIQLVGKDLLVESGMKAPMILFGETKVSSGR